jgi:N-acetylglucosamine-6-phosphate deacetylase
MSAAGMPDGAYTLGTFEVAVAEGKALLKSDLDRGVETLAGSVLTMDKAVANVQTMTGASLGVAVNLASANPARMLGLDPAIRPGTVGHFNRFGGDGRLVETILHGKAIN